MVKREGLLMYNHLCSSVYRSRLIYLSSQYVKSPYYKEEIAYNFVVYLLGEEDDE